MVGVGCMDERTTWAWQQAVWPALWQVQSTCWLVAGLGPNVEAASWPSHACSMRGAAFGSSLCSPLPPGLAQVQGDSHAVILPWHRHHPDPFLLVLKPTSRAAQFPALHVVPLPTPPAALLFCLPWPCNLPLSSFPSIWLWLRRLCFAGWLEARTVARKKAGLPGHVCAEAGVQRSRVAEGSLSGEPAMPPFKRPKGAAAAGRDMTNHRYVFVLPAHVIGPRSLPPRLSTPPKRCMQVSGGCWHTDGPTGWMGW